MSDCGRVLEWPFCSISLPVAPRGDFLDVEKVTKDTHRDRVFPLKGLSRCAAVATFYLNEPLPATTKVGLGPLLIPPGVGAVFSIADRLSYENKLGIKTNAR